MDPYDAFIQLADQIIQAAQKRFLTAASPFERNYYKNLIQDLHVIRGTILLHKDLMAGSPPFNPSLN